MIEGFIKFLIATVKTFPEEEANILIQEKLKELINSELDECVQVTKVQENEWGEVAVRVSGITKEIVKGITARKIS